MLKNLSIKMQLLSIVVIPIFLVLGICLALFLEIDKNMYPILYLVSFLSISICVYVVYRIFKTISKLETHAKKIAEGDEFEEIENPEKLTKIAEHLNIINRNIQIAETKQRENIKKGISEIVINLARRMQLLLDRQVEMLDELEKNEEDPDILEKLFTVDQLTTRMRRNSESLLVLADADVTRKKAEPVRISDVCKFAVSEVENFEKVSINIENEFMISNSLAVDLAHIIAELLENATEFSPPGQQVQLDIKTAIDDHLVINVIDHGIGMSGPQKELANEILRNPPDLDLSMSRSLGFAVVARLAMRAGFKVTLFDTPGAGVSAVINIPTKFLSPVLDFSLDGISELKMETEISPQQEPTAQPGISIIDQLKGIKSKDNKSIDFGSDSRNKDTVQFQIQPEIFDDRESTPEEEFKPVEKISDNFQQPQTLDEALPSSETIDNSVKNLLNGNDQSENNSATSPLAQRVKGASGAGIRKNTEVEELYEVKSSSKSARKPEEIRKMLSQYRRGIKGINQDKGDNNDS